MLKPLVRSSIVTGLTPVMKQRFDAGIGSCFHFVEEGAQITFAIAFRWYSGAGFRGRREWLGEVVVLVDKEVHLLSGTFAFRNQIV